MKKRNGYVALFVEKTRNRIREDMVLLHFPLCCPKCKQERLVEVKKLQVNVTKEQTHRRRADELVSDYSLSVLYFESINF